MEGGTTAATRWQHWASFALGLWLAVSPWALGYSHLEAATTNAAFIGLALALGSHFEVSFDETPAEWFNMAAGLWLVLAPFLLGFGTRADVTANSIAVGTAVAALASSALSLDKEVAKWWQDRAAGPLAPRSQSLRK
jgi:SPW repeat